MDMYIITIKLNIIDNVINMSERIHIYHVSNVNDGQNCACPVLY